MAITSHHYVTENSPGIDVTRAWLTAILEQVRVWRQRASGRAQLARMSARDLHDIGISIATADFEAGKPFWRG